MPYENMNHQNVSAANIQSPTTIAIKICPMLLASDVAPGVTSLAGITLACGTLVGRTAGGSVSSVEGAVVVGATEGANDFSTWGSV